MEFCSIADDGASAAPANAPHRCSNRTPVGEATPGVLFAEADVSPLASPPARVFSPTLVAPLSHSLSRIYLQLYILGFAGTVR